MKQSKSWNPWADDHPRLTPRLNCQHSMSMLSVQCSGCTVAAVNSILALVVPHSSQLQGLRGLISIRNFISVLSSCPLSISYSFKTCQKCHMSLSMLVLQVRMLLHPSLLFCLSYLQWLFHRWHFSVLLLTCMYHFKNYLWRICRHCQSSFCPLDIKNTEKSRFERRVGTIFFFQQCLCSLSPSSPFQFAWCINISSNFEIYQMECWNRAIILFGFSFLTKWIMSFLPMLWSET